LKITDITKIIARSWGQIDQQGKEYYEKKNQEAKALYERQMKLFEATYGKIEKKLISPFQTTNHPNPADSSDDSESQSESESGSGSDSD